MFPAEWVRGKIPVTIRGRSGFPRIAQAPSPTSLGKLRYSQCWAATRPVKSIVCQNLFPNRSASWKTRGPNAVRPGPHREITAEKDLVFGSGTVFHSLEISRRPFGTRNPPEQCLRHRFVPRPRSVGRVLGESGSRRNAHLSRVNGATIFDVVMAAVHLLPSKCAIHRAFLVQPCTIRDIC